MRLLASLLLTTWLALPPGNAHAQETATMPDTTRLRLRARAAADTLQHYAREMLLRHLATRGPAGAVIACADTAQQLNRLVEKSAMVSIRRVSSKWRNPADAPDSLESEILDEMNTLLQKGALTETTEIFRVVQQGEQVYIRYMRPILVKGTCLSCHGTPASIRPETARILAERYPADLASGYSVGQLRGAMSVKIRP